MPASTKLRDRLSSSSGRPAPLIRYGFAAILSVGVIAVRLAVPGLVGEGNWFIQMHPAVLLAAWVGGVGPGLLATAIGSMVAAYIFVPPAGEFPVTAENIRLTIAAAAIGALISVLTGKLRDSQSQLQDAAREAQAAEQRYRRLLDMSPVAVFVNADDRIVYANESMQALFGAPGDTLVGRSPLDLIDPGFRELARSRIAAMRSSQVAAVPWAYQLWRRPDGGGIHMEAAAAVIPWPGGAAIQVILRDISAERAAAEEHRRLLDEAQRANQAKDDFLATLSHELRTPINVVLGWLHMLRKAVLPEVDRHHALETIYRNTLMQARLVDDVLDMSRITTGQLSMATERVDMGELAHATVDALAAAFSARQQRVSVSADSGSVVAGDPHRLRQVLWNVLSNAAKFTPDHGKIAVAVGAAAGMVECSITDTGEGVDAKFLPHMFEPFRQADSGPTRNHGGLGLGLALVRRLVEAHGGTARAYSAGSGRGTTVVISLPMLRREQLQERNR